MCLWRGGGAQREDYNNPRRTCNWRSCVHSSRESQNRAVACRSSPCQFHIWNMTTVNKHNAKCCVNKPSRGLNVKILVELSNKCCTIDWNEWRIRHVKHVISWRIQENIKLAEIKISIRLITSMSSFTCSSWSLSSPKASMIKPVGRQTMSLVSQVTHIIYLFYYKNIRLIRKSWKETEI